MAVDKNSRKKVTMKRGRPTTRNTNSPQKGYSLMMEKELHYKFKVFCRKTGQQMNIVISENIQKLVEEYESKNGKIRINRDEFNY